MMSYSQKLFYDSVERIKQLYYSGKTADEISTSTNLSLLLVEGILERYINVREKD